MYKVFVNGKHIHLRATGYLQNFLSIFSNKNCHLRIQGHHG